MRRARRAFVLCAVLAWQSVLPAQGQAQNPLQAPALQPAQSQPLQGGQPFLPAPSQRQPVPTGPADPAIDGAYGAYQAGFFLEAFRQATRRIEEDANDAAAMTLLAELHLQGLGVKQDSRKATEWYRLAMARGDVNATFALGMLTLQGQGLARDEPMGRDLLQKAAAKGHGPAAFNLALPLLVTGNPEDLKRAIPLLQQAAEREVADAQHALAVLMLDGRGLPLDVEGGADMMARAASNGSLAGEVELSILQFTGRGLGRDERAAARGFARAAARGNAIAQNRLARILFQGRWLTRDAVSAGGWHLAAKAQGLADEALDVELGKLADDERARAQAFSDDVVAANALTRPGAAAQTTATDVKK